MGMSYVEGDSGIQVKEKTVEYFMEKTLKQGELEGSGDMDQ